jgi:DNA-binding transcriptional MerR regulator
MENVYRISQLCELFNVTPRLIYYYISIGLLPPAGRRGKNNFYTEEFVDKLRHVLKYRGRMKLAHIPFAMNAEFSQSSDDVVVTLKFNSSNTKFLTFAFDSCVNAIDKFGITTSAFCPPNSNDCMIVAFPVNLIVMDVIRQTIKGLKEFSRSFDGGVSFKAYISEDAFYLNSTEKNVDG